MKNTTLLFPVVLWIAAWPLGAQAQNQSDQPPTTESADSQPAHVRIEDTPEYKALTPEQQKQIEALPDGPEKDMAFAMLASPFLQSTTPPAPIDYSYHGQATAAAQAAPAPAPPPPAPAKPCAPPKLTLMQRLKLRAEALAVQQAQKADAKIAKGTQGNVTGATTDAAIGAVQQANQPKPCVVAPKQ
jgi:hypothetical protein